MKIAVLTQYWPTSAQPWGGHSAYQTVRLLAQRHTVRAFFPESRYPALLTPKSRTYGHLDGSYQPQGVATEYIPYPVLPFISRPLNGAVIARKLLSKVHAFAPDVILNYVVYPDGYAAVQIGRTLGVPVVLTAIGSDLNRIPDRFCAVHTRRAIRDATFTTTVSADLLRTARMMGAPVERSAAIINGCDTSVFYPSDRAAARLSLGVPQEVKAIVYVGRLDARKGLVELIEATAQLRQQGSDTHCYMVGDGPDKRLLQQAIERTQSAAYVHFVPAVRTHGVAQWMAAADLIALPSYAEGCPNVIIEALAAGRPVVATKVGGIPELVDESCGALVAPRQVGELRDALQRILESPWDAELLGRRHNRSWNDVAVDLENVLENALATRQRG